MSLSILSSSLKGSFVKAARLSAAVSTSRPATVWTSRLYSTEQNNNDNKDNKEGAATQDTTAESASAEQKENAKSPHEEALAAKDKQIAEIKVKNEERTLTRIHNTTSSTGLTLLTVPERQEQAMLRNNNSRDMENLRQRTAKEVASTKEYAIQKFAKDLLDTADILVLAIKNVPAEEISETSTNNHLKSLHTGVSMTRDELLKTLKRHGVEPYDPINEKFDPNLHQANFQVPMPDKEPGTVFDVQKVGFMLKGRVLRPAQVGVVQSTD
ncbi:Mitochondrial matrix cochaperone [Entomortierella chlamydospora]|uniref:GrpE protein homolog n=1 Tax=Entomortierella chlamydospora TaxID=101097 RepID=A0A9P6MV61_9FUNG|nr:Mitochondrial matrix cochaperone [Entomortierella chlamydospora]